MLIKNMKKEVRMVERNGKLYIYSSKSFKKEAKEFFRGFEGALKIKGKKMSATEFVRQLRRETKI